MVIFPINSNKHIDTIPDEPIKYRKFGSKHIQYFIPYISDWKLACSFDDKVSRDEYFEYLTKPFPEEEINEK